MVVNLRCANETSQIHNGVPSCECKQSRLACGDQGFIELVDLDQRFA
jgi:hypothetical protein